MFKDYFTNFFTLLFCIVIEYFSDRLLLSTFCLRWNTLARFTDTWRTIPPMSEYCCERHNASYPWCITRMWHGKQYLCILADVLLKKIILNSLHTPLVLITDTKKKQLILPCSLCISVWHQMCKGRIVVSLNKSLCTKNYLHYLLYIIALLFIIS